MKLLVLVKQVPRLGDVRFQPGLNRIVREGVTTEINPLDAEALRCAVGLREVAGGEIVVATMGPPQAREALDAALAAGADRAVHLADMRFAGADTLATARALARLVEREQPDVVVFGRSTTDGGTAQTPSQVAELSGLPVVTDVVGVRLDDGGTLLVEQADGAVDREWQCEPPVVLSVESGGSGASVAAGTGGIEELDADGLGGDAAGYGIRGSATYVAAVEELVVGRESLTTTDPLRVLAEVQRAAEPQPVTVSRTCRSGVRELWVVTEAGDPLPSRAFEAIGAAGQVADRLDARVVAVVLGDADARRLAALGAHGADRLLVAEHAALTAGAATDLLTDVLAELVAARRPLGVICAWDGRGRDYAGRVAARLRLGLTGDFVGLDLAPHPGAENQLDLVWLKPAWAGTVTARVVARTTPSMGTLRPGAQPVPSPEPDRQPEVERVVLSTPPAASRARVVRDRSVDGAPDFARPVLLLIGEDCREDDAAVLQQVASSRGWQVGATPGAVAAGRFPQRLEISVARRSFAPRVVLACGARPEDLAPVAAATTVVSVDPDPDAALHAQADLAAVMTHRALADAAQQPAAAGDR